jgi:hypothetical protein
MKLTLAHLIFLKEAMGYHDYETTLTIGIALQNSTVSRLQNTWKVISRLM